MRFQDIEGNELLKERLISMVREQRVGHAIMFCEEDGWGAIALALSLAQYISCRNRSESDSCGSCPQCNKIQKLIHPDIHFAFPVNVTAKSSSDKKPVSENFLPIWRNLVISNPYFTEQQLSRELGIEDKVGTISVSEAKEILSSMNLRSYEGGNKYMIIWLPERMTAEAANKLLKIIEEPFAGTYFFLITHSPEKVIRTITSRCLQINLMPIDTSHITGEISPYFSLLAEILSSLISKNLTALIAMVDNMKELGREKQKEFCLHSEAFIRKMLMVRKGLGSLAAISPQERDTINSFSSAIPDTFYEKAYKYFEEARIAIEGNVNSKMVFLNLFNSLFCSI